MTNLSPTLEVVILSALVLAAGILIVNEWRARRPHPWRGQGARVRVAPRENVFELAPKRKRRAP